MFCSRVASGEAGKSPITAMPEKSRLDQLHRKANVLQAHSRSTRSTSPRPTREHRPLRLPRRQITDLLPRLEHGRSRRRRDPARRSGPRSLRPRSLRPHRRALHPQRAVPALWAAHNVRTHDTGIKHVQHPLVGELNLNFEAMELVADPGLTMFVYTAEAGSKTEQSLNLLASWTATPDEETADADHQEQPRHVRRP